MISSTCWRTASRLMPSDSSALAATPPSWIEAEEDVLGADVVVVEEPGFFLGQDHDTCPVLGEPFETCLPAKS